jgi:hypothetical protein
MWWRSLACPRAFLLLSHTHSVLGRVKQLIGEAKLQEGQTPALLSCCPLQSDLSTVCFPPPSHAAEHVYILILQLRKSTCSHMEASCPLSTKKEGPLGLHLPPSFVVFHNLVQNSSREEWCYLLGLLQSQQMCHPFLMVGNIISHTLTKKITIKTNPLAHSHFCSFNFYR